MKRLVIYQCVILSLNFALCCRAGEVGANTNVTHKVCTGPVEHPIVIAVVGAPMTNLQYRVAEHVSSEIGYPVRMLPQSVSLANSPEMQARALAAKMKKSDLCLVALINPAGQISSVRSAVFTSEKVALVDVPWLRTSARGDRVSENVLRLRLCKEVMRAVGKLLGLQDCPYPRCCMFLSGTYAELDAKGMDFCPPCQVIAERTLEVIRRHFKNDGLSQ